MDVYHENCSLVDCGNTYFLSASGTIMIVAVHISPLGILMLVIAILGTKVGITARTCKVLHVILLVY